MQPDFSAIRDQSMCAQLDEYGSSVMVSAQRLIAIRRKVRFDAHCLIVLPDLARIGHTPRPLQAVHDCGDSADGGDPRDRRRETRDVLAGRVLAALTNLANLALCVPAGVVG
jgi:hypothetical protein